MFAIKVVDRKEAHRGPFANRLKSDRVTLARFGGKNPMSPQSGSGSLTRQMKPSFVLILAACVPLLLSGCAELRRAMGASATTDRDVLTGGPVTGITLSELPEPVRQALKREETSAEVADIQKISANGRTAYRISLIHAKGPPVLEITEDGRVLKR